jgi:hypothetical protein
MFGSAVFEAPTEALLKDPVFSDVNRCRWGT